MGIFGRNIMGAMYWKDASEKVRDSDVPKPIGNQRVGIIKRITRRIERDKQYREEISRETPKTQRIKIPSFGVNTEKPVSVGGKSMRVGAQNPFERSNNNPFEPNPDRSYWIVKPKEEYVEPLRQESIVHKFGENQSPFISINKKSNQYNNDTPKPESTD